MAAGISMATNAAGRHGSVRGYRRGDFAGVLYDAVHDARVGHDLLRGHSDARRRVRQLYDSADDRRAGYGVSEAQYDVVLVHVAGVHHHDGEFLCRRGRGRGRLDLICTARERASGIARIAKWTDTLAARAAFCRHLVVDGFD